jgi:hypothetical protein
MAITSISTPSAFTITSGDIGSSRAGITTSSSFNDWRKYTNLIAEDTEDLAIAINTINTAGAPAASPTFTGNVTVPLLTYIASPSAAQEKHAAPRKYVDDRIATVDDYNSWKLKINNSGEVSVATGKKVDFINASNSAITVTKSESPSGEFNVQHTFNIQNVNTGTLPNARLPDLTVANLATAAKQLGGSTFADNDTSVLTAAAVDDRISTRLTNFTTGDLDAASFINDFGLAKSLASSGTGLDGGGAANSLGQIPAVTIDFNELAINASTNTNDYFIVGDRSSGTTIDGVPDRAKFSTIDITHLNYNNKISLNQLSNVDDTFSPLVNSSGATGSILRYQNGEWQTSTAPLSDTNYSASSTGGLTLSTTTFSLKNNTNLSANVIMRWDNTNNQLVNSSLLDSTYVQSSKPIAIKKSTATDTDDLLLLDVYTGASNSGNLSVVKHSIFTGTNTRKSGINFRADIAGNDHGVLVHESGVLVGDNNKSCLHICPGDDTDNVNDVVAIHGRDEATSNGLILGTGGDITQVNDLILRSVFGTQKTNIINNVLNVARCNSSSGTSRRGGRIQLAKGNHDNTPPNSNPAADFIEDSWGIQVSSARGNSTDDLVIYDYNSGSARSDLIIREDNGVVSAPRATVGNITGDHDLVTLEKMVSYTDTRIALKLFGPRPKFRFRYRDETSNIRIGEKGEYYDHGSNDAFIQLEFYNLAASGFQKHETLNKYYISVRVLDGFGGAADDPSDGDTARPEGAIFLSTTGDSIANFNLKTGMNTVGAHARENRRFSIFIQDMVSNRQYFVRLPAFTGFSSTGNSNIERRHLHDATQTGNPSGNYSSHQTSANGSFSFFGGSIGLSSSLLY